MIQLSGSADKQLGIFREDGNKGCNKRMLRRFF